MGTIHLELSADLQALIDQQVTAGRVTDAQSFLTEAVEHYASQLEWENGGISTDAVSAWEQEIAEIAQDGIADIEAGRFVTIESREDAAALMAEILAGARPKLAEG